MLYSSIYLIKSISVILSISWYCLLGWTARRASFLDSSSYIHSYWCISITGQRNNCQINSSLSIFLSRSASSWRPPTHNCFQSTCKSFLRPQSAVTPPSGRSDCHNALFRIKLLYCITTNHKAHWERTDLVFPLHWKGKMKTTITTTTTESQMNATKF